MPAEPLEGRKVKSGSAGSSKGSGDAEGMAWRRRSRPVIGPALLRWRQVTVQGTAAPAAYFSSMIGVIRSMRTPSAVLVI
jgi:hypothetical protein